MLKEFFYFPKSDRKAMTVLLVVAVVVLMAVYGLGDGHTPPPTAQQDSTDTTMSTARNDHTSSPAVVYGEGRQRIVLRPFDPNTADSTTLLALGLSPWQVRNIYRYRERGGVYRRPSDFAKLYGLTVKHFRMLEPYIRISDDYRPASELFASGSDRHDHHPATPDAAPRPVDKLAKGETVDLADADTAALKRVPGIGSYYARRIVDYRERLGGFHSSHQLMEIDGFPEDALDYMRLSGGRIRKMNINRMTLTQMRRHPYISFFQARAITDYRRLKGPVESIDNLRLMKEFGPEDIRRLRPYLEY